MKKLLGIFILVTLTSCTMEPKIVLSTPGSVTIKSPRNMLTPGVKTTQEIYDIAQKHCKEKSNANAVATKSWLIAFDGNYHEFECKKP